MKLKQRRESWAAILLGKMTVTNWTEELVQLFEYQVEDLQAGRPPRGTRQSFQELREALLLSDGLDGPLRARFLQAERLFRELQHGGQVKFSHKPRPRLMPSGAAQRSNAAETAQHALNDRLWRADAGRWLFAQLWAQRGQPALATLRLLGAALETVRQPEQPRPIFSLAEGASRIAASAESLQGMAAELLPLITSRKGRQALAGALEHGAAGLAEAGPHTADLSGAGKALLGQTAERITALLERWPTQNPRPLPPLLEGSAASTSEDAFILHLADLQPGQPRVLDWAPLQVTLAQEGNNLWLTVLGREGAEQCVPLQASLPEDLRLWQLHTSGQLIHAVLEGEYLLLRTEQAASQGLGLLASQARVAAALTHPEGDYAAMRLARAAAFTLRGQAPSGDLSAASGAQYAQAGAGQLGQLAARGAEALQALSLSLAPEERRSRLELAAQSIGLEAVRGQLLGELLPTASLPEPIFDASVMQSGRFPLQAIFTLLEAPLSAVTLNVSGQTVQIFPQPDQGGYLVTALRPSAAETVLGLPSEHFQPLQEFLVSPLGSSCLLLAEEGEWLAQTREVYST